MFVDIIIPTFNPGKELIEAVLSCKRQTYSNYRITVVDDCSDVDVKRLLWDFSDINYIKGDVNQGPAGARNLGIRKTEGELVSFLDSDDLMNKDKLRLSVSCLERKKDIGMVCGNYRILVNRNKIKEPFYKNKIKINHSKLMRQNFVASGSVTVRREVLEDVGLFDESLWIAEDYDLWLRISERYGIEYLHEVLYYYSVIPGGTSLTQRGDIQASHDENIQKIRRASIRRVENELSK